MSIVSLGSEVEVITLAGFPRLTELLNTKGIASGQTLSLYAAGCGAGKSMSFYNEFVNSLPKYKLVRTKSKQSRYVSVCVKPLGIMFIGDY